MIERKDKLQRRLDEIEKERERALNLPEATEDMVNDVLVSVQSMLGVTDSKELKLILARFIERIEV